MSRSSHTLLTIKVQPKASANAIDGFAEDADGNTILKLRVTAVPDKGKANKAVIVLLAKALGLSKSGISITAGEKSRTKTVRIDADAHAVRQRLEASS